MLVEEPVLKCHSPHGECGLKYVSRYHKTVTSWSLPAWGVWIEISGSSTSSGGKVSLPAWGVWIEIDVTEVENVVDVGHSPHGECGLKFRYPDLQMPEQVTPRMGSVD